MDLEAFGQLPVVVDEANQWVGDYLREPPKLRELWRRMRNLRSLIRPLS